jgi:hypothetical protein
MSRPVTFLKKIKKKDATYPKQFKPKSSKPPGYGKANVAPPISDSTPREFSLQLLFLFLVSVSFPPSTAWTAEETRDGVFSRARKKRPALSVKRRRQQQHQQQQQQLRCLGKVGILEQAYPGAE